MNRSSTTTSERAIDQTDKAAVSGGGGGVVARARRAPLAARVKNANRSVASASFGAAWRRASCRLGRAYA